MFRGRVTMNSFESLRRKVLLTDALLLLVGISVLFLLGLGRFWYPFALGVSLGILNFHLHALSVQRIADAVGSGGGPSAGAKAALLYVGRFMIIGSVLAYFYVYVGMDLLPAIAGLLLTYAVLITTGIMDARCRKRVPEGPDGDSNSDVVE
ncbi:MAG: ATP synthase subunit I [Bacillota bacterium]